VAVVPLPVHVQSALALSPQGNFCKVDELGVAWQFSQLHHFLLPRLILVQFLKKITVTLIGIANGLLLLNDSGMLAVGSGNRPFELKIRNNGPNPGMLLFESMRADMFRQIDHALGNPVSHVCIR
jgi:hypothetical protein